MPKLYKLNLTLLARLFVEILNSMWRMCYWVSAGTCSAPSPGADELAIESAEIAFTKHPSICVLVVVAASR